MLVAVIFQAEIWKSNTPEARVSIEIINTRVTM